MQANTTKAPAAIRFDLAAIFVSLELSRSKWLVTSLSPGGGERMSRHLVSGGDIPGLLDHFAELQQKAEVRTGQNFRSYQSRSLPNREPRCPNLFHKHTQFGWRR